jgi:hypothetical protein
MGKRLGCCCNYYFYGSCNRLRYADRGRKKDFEMNYITPQTALQLKAAGFPQPKPATGQHWYSRSQLGGPYLHYIQDGSSPVFAAGQPTPEWLAFAPAAEDILRAMPGIFVRYDAVKKVFVCGITGVWGEWGKAQHETLPEALALAYLNAHNPK